ncbi:MAG TPA: hypothetical protein VFI96_01710 [Longimicrobiaceae bacterium]|nr:hypothetical protein [Longimicrobiaceae bacterium]
MEEAARVVCWRCDHGDVPVHIDGLGWRHGSEWCPAGGIWRLQRLASPAPPEGETDEFSCSKCGAEYPDADCLCDLCGEYTPALRASSAGEGEGAQVASLRRTIEKLHASGRIDRLAQVALGVVDGVAELRAENAVLRAAPPTAGERAEVPIPERWARALTTPDPAGHAFNFIGSALSRGRKGLTTNDPEARRACSEAFEEAWAALRWLKHHATRPAPAGEREREEVAKIMWSFRGFYLTLDEAKHSGQLSEEVHQCYLHTDRILATLTPSAKEER